MDVEGFPFTARANAAEVQDWGGVPDVILAMLEVTKLWAVMWGLGPIPGIFHRQKETKGFIVLYLRWVVERTFAWLS